MQRGIRGLTGGRRGDGACSSAEAQDGLQSGGGDANSDGGSALRLFFFFPRPGPNPRPGRQNTDPNGGELRWGAGGRWTV